MRRLVKVIISIAVVVTMISAVIYTVFESDHYNRTYSHNFYNNSVNATIDPFNNTTGTMFTVNFTISDYSGGPITFTLNYIINSSYTPSTYAENTTLFNLGNNTSYGISFYSNTMIKPLGNTRGAGEYNLFLPITGIFTAAGPVLEWNSNGIWNIPMKPFNLPAGQYNVSYEMKYINIEPQKGLTSVDNGSSTLNILSFEASSSTSMFGNMQINNLTIVKG